MPQLPEEGEWAAVTLQLSGVEPQGLNRPGDSGLPYTTKVTSFKVGRALKCRQINENRRYSSAFVLVVILGCV